MAIALGGHVCYQLVGTGAPGLRIKTDATGSCGGDSGSIPNSCFLACRFTDGSVQASYNESMRFDSDASRRCVPYETRTPTRRFCSIKRSGATCGQGA